MLLKVKDGAELPDEDEHAENIIGRHFSFIFWFLAGFLLLSALFSGSIEWGVLYLYVLITDGMLGIAGLLLYIAPKERLWRQRILGVMLLVLSIINLIIYL